MTLKASATTVRWGTPLRLTGKSTFPGTPVNIAERVPGSGTVLGGGRHRRRRRTDGSFAVELKPQRGAQYRAQVAADQISSGDGADLGPAGAHDPRALAAREGRQSGHGRLRACTPAHAATMLDLQRLDPRHGRWLTDLRKRTTANGQVTFKWKAVEGRDPPAHRRPPARPEGRLGRRRPARP